MHAPRFPRRLKNALLLGAVVGAAITAYVTRDHISQLVGNRDALVDMVDAWGIFGPIAFLLMNIAQVVVAPVPGTLIGVAAGYLFGPWIGFALNITGIVVGSIIAFQLARAFGKPLVDRWVSDRVKGFVHRFSEGSGVFAWLVIFLIPFLPDDALCFLAGLTSIHPRVFVIIVLIGRTPSALMAAWTGALMQQVP